MKYVIGIDLGTTNSALAYTEIKSDADPFDTPDVRLMDVPQLVNAGEVRDEPLLPSSLYVPAPADFPAGSLGLPWNPEPDFVVGRLAQKRGVENAGRLVVSAKSWLSHSGVDRTAAILPWNAPDGVQKLSPVEASSRYLDHLRRAWDSKMPDAPFAEQQVLVTVPASFDAVARELTLQAAERAGFREVTLLEEPQAAFYAWIERHKDWRERVKLGDLILVVDIGGGTTDFTLIAVTEHEGELALERMAVGEHILLGGDNMDLALARLIAGQLAEKGTRIDTLQLHQLWQNCRVAKEKLLEPGAKDQGAARHHSGQGHGACGRHDQGCSAARRHRQCARRRLLSYSLEFRDTVAPAPIRSAGNRAALCRGCRRHQAHGAVSAPASLIGGARASAARPLRPGCAHARSLQWRCSARASDSRSSDRSSRRVARRRGLQSRSAAHWRRSDACRVPRRGLLRAGEAWPRVRIRGGVPRSYYVGIESAMPAVPGMPAPLKALTVAPFGMEEGTSIQIPNREFGLVVGVPAEFRFFSSAVRKNDAPGAFIEEFGDDLQELSPMEVHLTSTDGTGTVPVSFETVVTETGMLQLWCVARDGRRWKLEFNVRERIAP